MARIVAMEMVEASPSAGSRKSMAAVIGMTGLPRSQTRPPASAIAAASASPAEIARIRWRRTAPATKICAARTKKTLAIMARRKASISNM